jgi:hypothetical protein
MPLLVALYFLQINEFVLRMVVGNSLGQDTRQTFLKTTYEGLFAGG